MNWTGSHINLSLLEGKESISGAYLSLSLHNSCLCCVVSLGEALSGLFCVVVFPVPRMCGVWVLYDAITSLVMQLLCDFVSRFYSFFREARILWIEILFKSILFVSHYEVAGMLVV